MKKPQPKEREAKQNTFLTATQEEPDELERDDPMTYAQTLSK